MKEEIIKIENIKPGDRFKNYKEFCKALEITPKSGNAKASQLKVIEKHIKYKLWGREFIIEEVSEKPMIDIQKPISKKKQNIPIKYPYKFTAYIQAILMTFLIRKHSSTNTINLTSKDIYRMLGLINRKFDNSDDELAFQQKHEDINDKQISFVKHEAILKAGAIVRYALESLEKQKLIFHRKIRIIVPLEKDAEPYEASPDEIELILKIERRIMKEMGYKNITDLCLADKEEDFHKKVNAELEQYGWKMNYSTTQIIYNENNIVEALEETENELMKEELNANFCGFLEDKMKRDYYQNRIEESMETARKLWDEKPENALKKLPFEECMEKFKTISDEFIKYINTSEKTQ